MEQIGNGGALILAIAVVLGAVCIGASLWAFRHGRVPGEGTVWGPGGFLLLACVPLVLALIGEPASDSEVPQLVPDWLYRDSTAWVAGIAAIAMALTLIVCSLLRGRAMAEKSREVDAAFLPERRGSE